MGGSHWYFPPAYKLNTYNKYYLMSVSHPLRAMWRLPALLFTFCGAVAL